MGSRKAILYLDVLNVLACICVVGMHCNGIVHNFDGSSAWVQSMVVETLSYWAVPVFFMLSGATMMNYRERYSTGDFFKRRILRVGIPFIFWTLFMAAVKYGKGDIVWIGFRDFAQRLLNMQIENVYWFFAPLFMVYLSMPVLSRLAEYKKTLWYMVLAGITTYSLLPFLCNVLRIAWNPSLQFPMTAGYILYAVLGYLLHGTEIPKKYRIGIYVLGILGVVVRYGYTVWASFENGALNKLTWGYLNWPDVVFSAAMFVFIKYLVKRLSLETTRWKGVMRFLASASFGIYLIHIFIMNTIVRNFEIHTSDLWWRCVGAFLIYGITLLLVKGIQKIPGGKYIVP